ncbi:hypothetical protein GSI_13136 [Ganoderma sinense ZZ0214-1]|uniref:Uncharacterized protein n=1 Tax=Ganoderma sinense ZZ0214-1 TaxID=1077348 RepID=A0A2G8RUQ9_9APHY|nr:hypothetical protein GSI_13136 [Ganoderma sinense ZZ0214-1]
MAADNSRRPRYGEEGAVLLDFRQKHRPPKAVIEAIGNDKTTSESFPIWGIELPSEPPAALSEEEKQNYLNQKARKQRTLEAKVNAKANAKANAKVKAKVKAKVNAKVKAKAKAAVSKSGQEKKPERPRPLRPAAPIVPTNAAPNATTGPVPVPPTTQSTTPSKRRAPPSCLPQVMAQAFSAAPGSTAIDHRPRAPAPTVTSFFPPSHPVPPPVRGSSQYAMPTALSVPQVCLDSVAQEGHAALATSLQPPKCFTPKPCCLTPSVVERLEQYAEGISIAPSHPAPRGIDAISPMMSSSLRSTYTDGDTHTFAQFTTPSLYSDTGSRSPSMDPSPSRSSIWAQTPVLVAAPLLPHTAPQPNAGPMVTQGFVGVNAQAHRRLSGSPSSSIVRGLTPDLVECYLTTAQKMGVQHVPQVYPPAMVHNHLDGILLHSIGDQDLQEFAQAVSPTQGGHSVVSSSPLAVAPYTDRGRSKQIGVVDNTYVYNQDVPVQYQRATSPSTYDVAAYYPLKQNSYSELSQTFQEPAAPVLKNQHARTSVESIDEGSWATVPQEASDSFYTPPYGSAFGRHEQSLIVDYAQSSTRTHLWSQSVYNSPQYPYNICTSTPAMQTTP